MQLEDYFDFLAPDDIRIRGHRIGIETVLYEYVLRRRSAEEIAQDFDTLTLDQVYATILYYLINKQRLDRLLEEWLEGFRHDRDEQRRQHPDFAEKIEALKQEAAHHPGR